MIQGTGGQSGTLKTFSNPYKVVSKLSELSD